MIKNALQIVFFTFVSKTENSLHSNSLLAEFKYFVEGNLLLALKYNDAPHVELNFCCVYKCGNYDTKQCMDDLFSIAIKH